MTRQWKRWTSLLALALLVLLAWLLWPDRKLAQAKALQRELTGPDSRSLSPEQRRDKWQQYRTLTEKFTPQQKDALSAEARKRESQELARYFALSPADKTRYLDDRIKGFEKMRQKMQEKAKQAGPKTPTAGGTGGPPGQSKGTPTTASRDLGRQNRLDTSSPAERAMREQFRKDMAARRAQLGLPPTGRGFGPPR